MRRAIYPGSFDPVTNGHLDIIRRGSRLFDRIVVAILRNPEKQPQFTLEERRKILVRATAGIPNVSIDSFDGLLVEYATRQGARVTRNSRCVRTYRRWNTAVERIAAG